jgi:hypothetical protein
VILQKRKQDCTTEVTKRARRSTFVNANCKVQIEKCQSEETYRRTGVGYFDFCILQFSFTLPALRGEKVFSNETLIPGR